MSTAQFTSESRGQYGAKGYSATSATHFPVLFLGIAKNKDSLSRLYFDWGSLCHWYAWRYKFEDIYLD